MNKTLSIGDTGDEVLNWQKYLVSQGFRVAVDGRFGPSTLAATRAMQRRLGVTADGKVGHRTIDRQTATSSTPLPQARPDMPPAPQPATDVLSGPNTGATAFQSSGPEADLNAMHSAASNNAADQSMAQELMGQYYDTRKADAAFNAPPAPVTRQFTDQGSMPPTHALDPAMMAAQGVNPNFAAAGPQGGGGAGMDLGGVGQAASPMGAPAVNSIDPIKRDQLIRALMMQAGGV